MAYISKKRTLENVIKVISGQDIPVTFNQGDSCRVFFNAKYSPFTGIISSFKAEKIQVTSYLNRENTIINYFTKDQQKVCQGFSDLFVSICHEIGHIFTMLGVNVIEDQRAMQELNDMPLFMDEKNRLYRQIHSEKIADEWAVDWIRENYEVAVALDGQIKKMIAFHAKRIKKVIPVKS